ncbi:TPA: hypothetical protein HA338_16950 [Methanosarcina acetivorans]|uniref:Uncharacterized protein n=2 Tax=Methanosarcina acetivorans TaxID=2214 RepID=Q8TKD2_METAC|nr:hypothetical protein [Methanosarcina acetivorans]AAM06842.1 predicted protein [Methanosarcina acetivorans C2A]HIH95615.1 hypothetical protein [Methanosarcina acetivorans]
MENKKKTLTYFTLLWGITYLVIGGLQILKGAGLLPENFITANLLPPELAGGLVLVVIGAVYLYGTVELSNGSLEGRAYAYVGIVLSMLFGALYSLNFIADLINAWVLFAEGFEEWTPLVDFKPALYLGLISFVIYMGWENKFKLQERGEPR